MFISMPRPKTTPKSQETRDRILRTATQLFRSEGFANTTLRRIAEEADVALGLSYRYFPQKQDLALALYLELAEQLEAATQAKPLPLADGFASALRMKLRLCAPHREALGALFAASLTQQGVVSVVGKRAAPVRERVRTVFARVVDSASDLPAVDATQRRAIVSVLYGIHLLVVLAWLVDARGSAARYIRLSRDAIARVMPLLALPPVRDTLERAAREIDSFLEGGS